MRINADDLIVWPCGEYCHRYELADYAHKSDDYRVISAFSADYDEFYARRDRLDVAPFIYEGMR